MAGLSMNLFLPCLLFVSVLNCVNPLGQSVPCIRMADIGKQCWFLFFWPLVVVYLGLGLGRVLSKLLNCPENFRKGCAACIAFGNATTWPILIFQSLGPELLHAKIIEQNPSVFLPLYLVL